MNHEEYQRNFELENHYWWFCGVRKMVVNFIQHISKKDSTTRMLDIGCGTGALLDDLKNLIPDLHGLDISSEALKFCEIRGHKNLVLGNGTSLPFPDNRFDLITAIGVIEHIQRDDELVKEIDRVLVPGGHAIIFTSSFQSLWSRHDVANHHVRRYRIHEVTKLMTNAKFNVVHASYFNFFLFIPIAITLIASRIFEGLNPDTATRILPMPPKIVNYILTKILMIEAYLSTQIRLPFGISLVGVYQKPKN